MRVPFRILICLVLGLLLTIAPAPAWADEPAPEEPAPAEATEQPADDKGAEKDAPPAPEPEPEPPRTYTVFYSPNGGEGTMEPSVFTEGQDAILTPCAFTRSGYSFEGWSTEPGGGGLTFSEKNNIKDHLTDDYLTLYAQWNSQVYVIRYGSGVSPNHDFPVEGTVPAQLVAHDAQTQLADCGYARTGYTAQGWMDAQGTFHDFGEWGVNYVEATSTQSWVLADVSIDLVRPDPDPKWSCQGSVVYRDKDGALCAALGFVLANSDYTGGSLANYDSEIMLVNLDTGELIAHRSGLMLEHANDIAYRPDNGHFYVAQGGLFDGYPNGIVELDENLNEVRTVTPDGTHHIWNISYSNGVFYAIGNVDGTAFARGNPEGETSDLIRMDEDLNVIDVRAIDYSPRGFTGQGLVCDGSFLYSILFNSKEADSALKQRLAVYTLEGEARGCQYLDVSNEVESASALDGKLYFSTNLRTGTQFFGTDLANATMTAVWRPNTYHVSFDANGVEPTFVPRTVDAEYDQPFALPADPPLSPGYEFVSWNTQPDGTGDEYAAGQEVSNLVTHGTIMLYAQWRRPAHLPLVADNGTRVRGARFPRGKHMRQRGGETKVAKGAGKNQQRDSDLPPREAQGPAEAQLQAGVSNSVAQLEATLASTDVWGMTPMALLIVVILMLVRAAGTRDVTRERLGRCRAKRKEPAPPFSAYAVRSLMTGCLEGLAL